MSKSLTIGSCTFEYPEAGTKPGWGEQATCWAVAVTNKLATLSGVNDICIRSFCIGCNQATAASIGSGLSALKFTTSGCCGVRSFVVDYAVTRVCGGCTTVEAGEMEGVFDGANWAFNHSFVGDAGVCFQICDSNGQVQYFSDNLKGSGKITYRARTIDQ